MLGINSTSNNQYLMINPSGKLQIAAPSVPWETRGNNNINDLLDFIGTINPADFIVRTDNLPRVYFKSNGYVGIGTDSPCNNWK